MRICLSIATRAIALCLVIVCASGRLFAASAQDASFRSDADARKALLSDAFFDDFYGQDAVELLQFGDRGRELALNFASDREKQRSSLDEKFNVDCSVFTNFELVVDCDNFDAIGYVSLYFHSKNGWYNATGHVKRIGANSASISFDGDKFGKEEQPGTLAEVDAVRISFWRGADVDAKLVFHGFKGVRRSFAIVRVDDGGRENDVFVGMIQRLTTRFDLPCELVESKNMTANDLSRYSCVFLPIAGGIESDAVDALCEYVDKGGFLFACYNVPPKLLTKLGVEVKGFVRCSDKGLDLSGLASDSNFVERAAANGFTFPEFIDQKSWNFDVVAPVDSWRAKKVSPVLGDDRAHTIAYWRDRESNTEFPALVASASGVYCSHVITEDSAREEKELLIKAFASAARPQAAKKMLRQELLKTYSAGVDFDDDLVAARKEALDYVEKGLAEKGWTLRDLANCAIVDDDPSAPVDYKTLAKICDDVRAIKTARIDEFLKSQPSRPKEGRLWWEHSGCGIYRGDWDRTMRELADAGFNGVVPNLLWGGAAYYKSDVLPNAPLVETYGDQIEQAVAAGKKHGVEVHAWMVCFNASNSPKWFLDKMSAEGRLQKSFNGEEKPWLCPSNPENQALELAALEEVATKYDVDGVHFDYIRYPDDNTCFCDGCKERFAAAFRAKTGRDLPKFPESLRTDRQVEEEWHKWRCEQITHFVQIVNESLRAKRPDIQISAAVFPRYPGTLKSIAQDWALWIEKGWLDFVCPMDYTDDPRYFAQLVESQLPYTKGKVPIYAGIGMTATGIGMTPDEVVLEASRARKLGADGFIIFNLTKSTADVALPAFKKGMTSEKTTRK